MVKLIQQPNNIIIKILEYLEPPDIKTIALIDDTVKTIIEDYIFWENYFSTRGRKIPKRIRKVSDYYLDNYEYREEAKRLLVYMEEGSLYPKYGSAIYNIKPIDIHPDIFPNFPEIKNYLLEAFSYQTIPSSINDTVCLFRDGGQYLYTLYICIYNENVGIDGYYEISHRMDKDETINVLGTILSNKVPIYSDSGMIYGNKLVKLPTIYNTIY